MTAESYFHGHGIPWKGNYTSWLEQKQERLRREEKSESERQKTLQRELEWIRMSPKARHAKGKARINAYESMLQEGSDKRREDLEIHIPAGPRLGNIVVEADGVNKAFGDNLLVDNMTPEQLTTFINEQQKIWKPVAEAVANAAQKK